MNLDRVDPGNWLKVPRWGDASEAAALRRLECIYSPVH